METRIATAMTQGKAAEAAPKLLSALEAQLGPSKPALVMAFASTAQPLSELMPLLAAKLPGVPLLGASTAGEFTEKGDAKSSVSLFAVSGDYQVRVGMGTGLKANLEGAVGQAAQAIPAELADYPHKTVVMLLDTLSGNAEEATLVASMLLGPKTKLVGGSPGDDLAMAKTYVASGTQVATDAVVLAAIFSKKPLGVGVQHGHRALSKPLKVTKAEANVVHTVNGRPAAQVWEEEVKEMAAKQGLNVADLKDPSKATGFLFRYEAGLTTGSGDTLKIRAPLSIQPGGAMAFACGLPEGVEFRITYSDLEGQITSAKEAATKAAKDLGAPAAGAVVFDCICRYTILGDRFKQAVGVMSEALGQVPLAGFETYGEVAMAPGGELSGFHNTTSVVLAFPR
jgi:methyl-accepting chemotaxis protein